jgi:hypothetical protein
MITRQSVSEKLLAYLNSEITVAKLADWAKSCLIEGGFSPDEDIPVLRDMVSYLAHANSSDFPLTWDVCADFFRQLGISVRVVAT